MNKLQLLRDSYTSKLQYYWISQTLKRQRIYLLIAFVCYSLVCFFIVKESFSSKLISSNQEKQSNIKPVKYLLEKQKIELKTTNKTKGYESQSIK